jgi:hypothetical protein
MLPLTLPCRALPSVLTQQPQSQSRKQHRETQNNPKRLQRAFFKYTPKKNERGKITQKKIKKPEDKKVERTSAAIQKTKKRKPKTQNRATDAHALTAKRRRRRRQTTQA